MALILIDIPNIDDNNDNEDNDDEHLPVENQLHLAGLNMDHYVETIRSNRTIWYIVSEFGAIFIWNGNRRTLRKISNVDNKRINIPANETDIFWHQIKLLMQKNEFVLVTIQEYGKAILYNCHRSIGHLKDGQNIIFMNNVVIWNGIFSDSAIPKTSKFKVERMRHIFLNSHLFRIRVQSDSNKIFIRNDDIVYKNINFNWIQQLP